MAYKEIVAKYFALDDVKPSYFNYGGVNEYVMLDFSSGSYQIDFRSDRLVFRYEDDYKLILNSSGPSKFFFDILEEVKKVKSFGRIRQVIVQIKSVEILSKGNEEVVREFKNVYLNGVVDSILNHTTDLAVTLERDHEGKYHNIVFGPFETIDVTKQGISPLKSNFNSELKGNGIMATYLSTELTDKSSFSFFKEMLLEMIELTKKIKI